ncbi:5,6-dimethylbenzimidazole synthase [Marinobacterium mangrovicola]|uniref:Cob(II)yrinic acid a,c-diamide reductase n=1 Tax=Marinobacterium mangrovicola TaxID=1476959 RepID=A0A4R1GFS6_9GAMM|nr:5,6-dimethylbenzimidazole synthase [Marinobacterium mangrovicola]TCK04709.1 cob(II)yrinic acid a,c-diamide reductase [Marinobacterium mangrovicola]
MSQSFSEQERAAVYRAIRERRDMRHFADEPLAPEVLERLLQAAHQAPSVGLMQPWRFIRITRPALRRKIRGLIEQERQATAKALDERESEFLRLKVEGVDRCAELLVVALMDQREQHIFGRRTLPEMDLASVACAIQNLSLAARAEGIGVGWVSLFDPVAMGSLLKMPEGSKAVAVLCIGPVDKFYEMPMLEQEGWASAVPLTELLAENAWPGAGHRE